MAETTLEKLDQALRKIDRPGSFCVSGSVAAVLPGLEVKGLGPIGLPLSAKGAKDLMTHCPASPLRQGREDPRRYERQGAVRRMEPDRFSLEEPRVATVHRGPRSSKAQEELGLEDQKLEAHLYDLLLYEPGSFFLPHRDGEKLDRMVATLVIVLPSSYEGRRDRDPPRRAGADDRFYQCRGIALFRQPLRQLICTADCEHEIRPVREGISALPRLQPDTREIARNPSRHRASPSTWKGGPSAHPRMGRRTTREEKLGIKHRPSVHGRMASTWRSS